ncbi:MAG TPA: CapA family protein [Candidatus Saccharimonadales bacterium]|nr:CapA family protein [Candidatus Saccharimonadales bacterium]
MRRTSYAAEDGLKKHFWQHRLLWSVLLVIIIFGVLWLIAGPETDYSKEPAITQAGEKPKNERLEVETRILFAGDTMWGRYIDVWSQESPLKTAYPFSRLKELGAFDARIANLECPIVSGIDPSAAHQEATLLFNCPPEYVKEAAKLFTAFSLANNHTNNQGGHAGLEETRKHLEKGGIQYFGHFDPEILDDVCEVISLPVRISTGRGKNQSGELPIAMCGYHGLAAVPSDASVGQITRYAELMPTFAYPHMGTEYIDNPDPVRTSLYRSMIDAGADAVFAAHPHWVQPTESYKGRLIAYSMGNFIFDQQFDSEVTRGADFDLTLSIDDISSKKLAMWLTIGKSCKKYKDDCLKRIKSQGLDRLYWKFDYKIVASDSSNRITKPAGKQTRKDILRRLDWANTLRQLKQH